MNPFLLKSYISAIYLCDRKLETKRIINAIDNQRNLTITSLRKMGKTALILHVFNNAKIKKKYDTLYVDIYDARNIEDFINIFGTAFLRIEKSWSSKIMKLMKSFMKSLKPSLSLDPLTGNPSVSFSVDTEQKRFNTLEEILTLIDKRSEIKPIIIAIDEFQQIAKFPEKNIEAFLRKHIQQMQNSHFIFSGSDKHMMMNMFSSPKRPFYQSTEWLHLKKIPEKEYKRFIRNKFKKKNVKLENHIIDKILEWTRCHTYYVQYVCNRLYASEFEKIEIEELHKIFYHILVNNEDYYYEYRNLLSTQQWKLLVAIAKEGGVEKITASDFIMKNDLKSSASVVGIVKSLIKKDLIFKEDKIYFVYDVFFSRWLERS